MNQAGPYPLVRRRWRERWRDGELLPDVAERLAPVLLIVATTALFISRHAAWIAVCPAVGGVLGAGISRASMRMRVIEPSDRAFVLDWLASNQYRQEPRGWVPDLPRLMRMRADTIRLAGSDVIGPRRALRALRRALMERGPKPAGA